MFSIAVLSVYESLGVFEIAGCITEDAPLSIASTGITLRPNFLVIKPLLP